MKYIDCLKKTVGYISSVLVLSVALNACNTPPGSSQTERRQKRSSESKKIIYILNALWPGMQEFNNLKNLLSTAFEDEGLNIEVKSLNTASRATSEQDITQQASEALEKIKRQVGEENHEVILIGHSQGGLRGAKILFLNVQKRRPLNIKGLITLGTPWEGAPAASITKTSVQSFLQKRSVNYILAGATYMHPATAELTNDGSINILFDQYFPTHEPGVEDMVPNSDFLQDLASNLAHNSTPILAIAGDNINVEGYIDYSAVEIEAYTSYLKSIPSGCLNLLYTRIFTGGWWIEHDMMVPLYSQLAQNIAKNDAFETYLVKGAIHDFLPGLSIPPDRVIYNHVETIERIVEFVKLNFGFQERKDTCCVS
ncbi:MAG: hypothetical protein BGO68_04555 [Candidatus Amoebophilus sp. 36-38]|nr:MAG: hypothetical protein BGO68_04555 [Candidatus Amoebophilus sp. 36-38]